MELFKLFMFNKQTQTVYSLVLVCVCTLNILCVRYMHVFCLCLSCLVLQNGVIASLTPAVAIVLANAQLPVERPYIPTGAKVLMLEDCGHSI